MQRQTGQNEPNNGQVSKQDFAQQIKKLAQGTLKDNYQIKMLIVFMLVSITTNLQCYSSSLLYMNPVFYCQGLSGKITQERACQRMETCTIGIYVNKQTVTAQLQLYCGSRTDQRIMIQTAQGIGSWLGLFFVAIISDRKGRKFGFVFSMVVMVASCLIAFFGINANITILLVFAQIFSGFAGKSIYFNFLILCTRFLKKDTYEAVSIFWLIISGITEMMIGVLNQHFQSWKSLLYIYSIGNIIATLLSIHVLYQDPVYLFDTENYEECKQIFRKISIQNGEESELQTKIISINAFIQIKNRQAYQIKESNFNWKELVKCDIIANVLILASLGCFLNMAIGSMNLSVQGLKLSYNQNLFIIGGSKITGNLLAILLLRIEQNRSRGFVFSAIICGLASTMFVFKFCTDSSLIQSLTIIVLRIGLCWSGCFYTRLKVDLFPQKYQGTLVGSVQFINIGKIIAPIFTQISVQNHINPIVSINVLKLTLGTLPIIFLKEKKLKTKQAEKTHKEQMKQ